MAEMKVQYVPIGQVKPYEKNPRKNKAAVDYVANSIKEFGWRQPIVTDKNFVIIVGHTRLQAAKKLKLKEVPVLVADDMTEEQAKAYRLADNKTAEFAEWDFDLLNDELLNLDMDMTLFGFENAEEETEPQEVKEDEIPTASESRCEPGDIWQLGEHRLICGDSTDPETINKLMDGGKAALLLTDPPYGIDVVGHNKVGGGGELHFGRRIGGNIDGKKIVDSTFYAPVIGDETTETARKGYEAAKEFSDEQILFGGNYFTDFLPPSRCWIVWDKQNTGNFADAELAWTSFEKGVRLYHFMWNGLAREGSRKVEGITRVHPTQKPAGMLGYILQDFSAEGDKILDTFGGSGSTMIACEQLNRKCYMAELDPHYCDIILERWETFTGKKAERIE